MTTTRRAGAGVLLVLGCTGLLTVTVVAVARLAATTGTLDRAMRGVGGAVAEQAALSAVEESLWRFENEVNNPSSSTFSLVRRTLVEDRETFLDLSEACRPTLEYLSEGEDGPPGLSVDAASLTLDLPTADAPMNPQLLHVEASVSHVAAGRTVHRRCRATYRWGATRVAPPIPYDQLTVATVSNPLLDTHTMTIGRWLDLMEEYEAARLRFGALLDFLNSFPRDDDRIYRYEYLPILMTDGAAPARDPAEDRVIGALMAREPWRRREWEWRTEEGTVVDEDLEWSYRRHLDGTSEGKIGLAVPGPCRFSVPELSGAVDSCRLLRDTVSPFSVIVGLEREVDLRSFDLPAVQETTFAPSWTTTWDLVTSLRELHLAQKELWRDDPPATPQRVQQTLNDFISVTAKCLDRMERAFKTGMPALNRVLAFALGHGLAQFPSPCSRPCAPVAPVAYHVDYTDAAKGLQVCGDTWGGVSGSVFVAPLAPPAQAKEEDDPWASVEPLFLKLPSWRGTTVLTAFRPTTVSRVGRRQQTSDLMVLSLNQASFRAERVEAGVSCARASFEGAPLIDGNLVVGILPLVVPGQDEARLQGRVVYDGRLFGGHFYDPSYSDARPEWAVGQTTTVSVHPVAVVRTVDRGTHDAP